MSSLVRAPHHVNVSADGRAAFASVRLDDRRHPEELCDPLGVKEVFTPWERRYCGSTSRLDRWAGRLAAKLAVQATAAGEQSELATIEIRSMRDRCFDPQLCARGHAPSVHLLTVADLQFHVRVTISHNRSEAIALATIEGLEAGDARQ